ncbi:MAG: hypothetical protein E7589_01250 [Ruminococcaceae bacterium]|nr:hypothetical protein [Oscillospiraceae bacterium]
MKRLFGILFTVIVIAFSAISVFAEGTADAQAITEATSEMTAAVTAAQSEALTTEVSAGDIEGLLDRATPEQIQAIKDYILFGLESVDGDNITGWDKVKEFVITNLDAIAWIFAGVAFIVFFIGNCISRKSASKDAAVMNNNTVEFGEAAKKYMGDAAEKVKEILAAAEALRTETALEMERLKNTETAYSESVELMATVVNELLQLSALPQWKRDEITICFNNAKARLEEVRALNSQTSVPAEEHEVTADENGQ